MKEAKAKNSKLPPHLQEMSENGGKNKFGGMGPAPPINLQYAFLSKKVTKTDGTILRAKQDMIKSYDDSSMPSPLNSIWNLDYCWKL
jgi:hypothetical protein